MNRDEEYFRITVTQDEAEEMDRGLRELIEREKMQHELQKAADRTAMQYAAMFDHFTRIVLK
jgi:hypothetical protein